MIINQFLLKICALCILLSSFASVEASISRTLFDKNTPFGVFLLQSMDFDKKIDVATIRLKIEREISPKVDTEKSLEEIDRIVRKIKQMDAYEDTPDGKINSIMRYLYKSGDWNDHKPYLYDFSDPLGTKKFENSLVSNYLETKKGNCVSMPILLVILGRKLGLDMTLAHAPKHFFAVYKNGVNEYNIEATAGGLKAKQSYIREFLITNKALENEIYLMPLSEKELVVSLLYSATEHYTRTKQYQKSLDLSNVMLEHDPNSVHTLLTKGNVYYFQLMQELKTARAKKLKIAGKLKEKMDLLLATNLEFYEKAESLGWKEPPKDYDQRYLKMVEEVKGQYEKTN